MISTTYIFQELILMATGLVFLLPRAIEESHEPLLSLWWDWAEMHKDNDFEFTPGDEWAGTNAHPAGWYDEEFEEYLDEVCGLDLSSKEIYSGLYELNKYLVKHKYVKRMNYWNHYVYQINTKKLY